MTVAVYQPSADEPMAIVTFVEEVDATSCASAIPSGLPFWIVDRDAVDSLYRQYGDIRDAWRVSTESIGRAPDGVGAEQIGVAEVIGQ